MEPDFPTFPTLASKRLILREHENADMTAYFNILSDKATVRYFGKAPLTMFRQAVEELELFHNKFRQGYLIKWALVTNADNEHKYIGSIGAFGFSDPHYRVTISCILDKQYWGMGLAYEALEKVLEYLFEQRQINRVQLYVDPVNLNAVNLFRHLGFQNEGLLREYEFEYGAPVDLYIMSLLKKEWVQKKSY